MLNSTETSVSCIRPIAQSTTGQPHPGVEKRDDSFTPPRPAGISQPQAPKDPYSEMVAVLRQKRETHQVGNARKTLRAFLGTEAFDNLSPAGNFSGITRFQGMGNSGRFNEQRVQQILLAGSENSLLRVLADPQTTREDVLEVVLLLQDMLHLEDVLLESEREPILKLRNALIPLIGPNESDAKRLFGPEGAKARELSLRIHTMLSTPKTSFESLLAAEKELSAISFMPGRETLLTKLRQRIIDPIALQLSKILLNDTELPISELGPRFLALQTLRQQIASLDFFPDQNRALLQIHNSLEKISFQTQELFQKLPIKCEEILCRTSGDAWKSLKYPQAKETLKTLKGLILEAESARIVLKRSLTALPDLLNAAGTLTESVRVLELVGWKVVEPGGIEPPTS